MGAKRKSYTPKYRREAARLVIDTGRTIVEVAREIGVGEQLLGRWVAAVERLDDSPPVVQLAAEAYRMFRTNLDCTSVDSPINTVMFTSANEGDGKTTSAINYALSMAEFGVRVLLIDCDLRKPTIAKSLGLAPKIGLTTCFAGRAEPADVIQRSGYDNLDVLCSGSLPPNPAELLGSKHMSTLLTDLSSSYSLIILDSPPTLAVADALVLTKWVDAVILVVKSGSAQAQNLLKAVEQLRKGQARVVGAILNRTTRADGVYHYYYGDRSRDSVESDV